MGRKLLETLILIKDSLLEIIYPIKTKCITCEEEDIEGICNECKKRIIKCENEISYAYYNKTLKKLILEFKFKKNFIAGEILSELLVEELKDKDENWVLTYVPISKKKLKNRGFNQCEYICKCISKRLDLKTIHALKQVKETKEQKSLNKIQRAKNVIGAFEIVDKSLVENKNIILIDDVITTGATIGECEKILKNNGAKRIKLLTIGKSDI